MPYDTWRWDTHHKKCIYYFMFCTSNTVFAKGGVRENCKYNFEIQKFNIRGYHYYRQRMYKGIGYGYREKWKWGEKK